MAKGSRIPEPNHKQSSLETLRFGGRCSLSGPLVGKQADHSAVAMLSCPRGAHIGNRM